MMSWASGELRGQIDRFLKANGNLAEFQRDFLGQYLRLPQGALPAAELPVWSEVYRLLCHAVPAGSEPAAGAIGEAELRRRLTELRGSLRE
jgi:hypothetical protein